MHFWSKIIENEDPTQMLVIFVLLLKGKWIISQLHSDHYCMSKTYCQTGVYIYNAEAV